MFGSLEVATTILLFHWLVPFPFIVFQKLFSSFFREFNGLFLLRAPVSVSEARVRLMTAALMRFDKLSKLSKTRALFWRGSPCFKRINRVYSFAGLLWNLAKMFLGYQCEKACDAFVIFLILLLSTLMWRRSANIQFANVKIYFIVKPHTLL